MQNARIKYVLTLAFFLYAPDGARFQSFIFPYLTELPCFIWKAASSY